MEIGELYRLTGTSYAELCDELKHILLHANDVVMLLKEMKYGVLVLHKEKLLFINWPHPNLLEKYLDNKYLVVL